jgi:hypothetical protein
MTPTIFHCCQLPEYEYSWSWFMTRQQVVLILHESTVVVGILGYRQ